MAARNLSGIIRMTRESASKRGYLPRRIAGAELEQWKEGSQKPASTMLPQFQPEVVTLNVGDLVIQMLQFTRGRTGTDFLAGIFL
jgi:hypothetical protein